MSNEPVINPTVMESKSPLIHLAAPTRSIPDIISSLRSEFRMSEFDRAEKMLLEREERLKEEVSEMRGKYETLKKEKDFLEKQNGEKDLKLLDLEDKLKKQQRESQTLNEKYTLANEDIRVLSDRKRRSEERFNEIYVDLEKKEMELRVELKEKSEKILVLKKELSKAEDLAGKWMKKFRECEPRVKQLEEDVSMLMSLPPVATPDNGVVSDKQSKDSVGNVNLESVKPQNHGIVSNGNKKIHMLPGAGSTIAINGSQGTGHGQVIQICDSDDELCIEDLTTVKDKKMSSPIPFSTKRKRASTCNISNTGGNDDGDHIVKRKSKSSKISDTGASSDSEYNSNNRKSNGNTGSFMDEQVTRKSNCKVYECEADMLHAFGEDDELCMSAVCALYRQEKTLKRHTPSSDRGFQTVYKINGPVLAEFLTDNDSQQNVRKSVSEFKQYIPKGVSSCREIARRHSKQLFELYKNKEDPFFRPS